jgi:hypothetical protein
LLASSLWISVLYAAPRSEPKPADNTAVQRIIEDSNAKTLAAVKDSNKQLADQLQQISKQVKDDQERVLYEIQSHIIAIRTALSQKQTGAQQAAPDTGTTTSPQSAKKTTRPSAR